MQTTNLLLAAGAEALRSAPGAVPGLAPLRSMRDAHRRAAAELGVGARQDMERLLSEVQQLLVGIAIMQARRLSSFPPWKLGKASRGSRIGGLLSEVQQLLVGTAIMQAGPHTCSLILCMQSFVVSGACIGARCYSRPIPALSLICMCPIISFLPRPQMLPRGAW